MSSCNFSKKQFGQHSADPNKPMLRRMLDGELYIAKDAKCQNEMEITKKWMARFNASIGLELAQRLAILKERIGTVADGVEVLPPFYCDYGCNLHLGANVFINYNCCFLDVCRIDIGANTFIGPAVQIYTADHPRDFELRQQQWEFGRPIWIGQNVWIGGGAIILPGVQIDDNSIIGAGAIVTRDVAKGETVVGNPARPLPNKRTNENNI